MLSIDLSGGTALVPGGSRGSGEGITRLPARAGARIVFTHTGNPARAGRLGRPEDAAALGAFHGGRTIFNR